MTPYRQIAIKIPDIIRSKKLMINDPIAKAEANGSNPQMQLLFAIWYEFVQPGVQGDMGCPKCLQRLLSNFREMKDELIALERDYQLLMSVK